MALKLKFSNSLASLAEILAGQDRAGLDPFAPEYIVIASTGLRRWISNEIASRRGITANCDFPTPRNFVRLLLGKSLGKEESVAFSKETMTWRLYDLLHQGDNVPELAIPSDYIRKNSASRDLATFQLAEKTADLFDQYLTYRPDWILSWEQGKAIVAGKAASERVRKHEGWQRYLWNQIAAAEGTHRARLYNELLDKLGQSDVFGLPERISVFGTHTLPPVFLEILKSLGIHHQVTIYLTQPTPEFWGDHPLKSLKSRKSRFLTETCIDGQDDDWGNPLIAAMGGQGRDLFNVLIDENISTSEEDDLTLFNEPAQQTVLGAVQRSVFRIEQTVENITDDPLADNSLRIHCCHHPLREVEVLQDTLLKFFADNSSLRPNDILVLAPDIEEYAPYIDSVFGQPEEGLPGMPYSIADRRFRSKSQVVDGFFKIVDICRSRFSVTELFSLFQSPVFRERFGLDDDALSSIRIWLSETRAAWGIDAEHRSAFGVPAIKDYTWQDTFEKIFLGYALPRQSEADPAACYDKVEGQDSILIGKLAEAFDLLKRAAIELSGSKTPTEWALAVENRIVRPFLDKNPATLEVRQIRHGLSVLSDTSRGVASAIELTVLKSFLETVFEDRSSAYGFLSRGITFGSLTPMRSIPCKVIYLLGMNNGAFPRDPFPLGFDLMKIRGMSRQGDRAANQSGRYLFLETILSATDKLHVSYCGYTPRDDSVSPPATPVCELLDFLHSTWPADDAGKSSAARHQSPFIVSHRLNGYHPDYFGDSNPVLNSYSKRKYMAAMAALEKKEFPIHQPVEVAQVIETITIDELAGFFINPAKQFLNQQIGASLPYEEKELSQEEPLEFNQLDAYCIKESRILQRLGWPVRSARVSLPPGRYGKWCRETVEAEADELHDGLSEAFGPEILGEPASKDISLRMKVGDRMINLRGEIPQIHGDTHLRFRPASLKPKDEILAWIHHLAINASGSPVSTKVAYAESRSARNNLKFIQFSPLEENADAILSDLLALYIEGQASPLPWILDCSMGYAGEWSKTHDDLRALNKAQLAWDSGYSYSIDSWSLLCWGNRPPFLEPNRARFVEVAKAVALPIMEYRC